MKAKKDIPKFRGMRRRVDPFIVTRDTKTTVIGWIDKPDIIRGMEAIIEAKIDADIPDERISHNFSFSLLKLGSIKPTLSADVSLPIIEPAMAPLAPIRGG